jgi:hypothetical protein
MSSRRRFVKRRSADQRMRDHYFSALPEFGRLSSLSMRLIMFHLSWSDAGETEPDSAILAAPRVSDSRGTSNVEQ